MTRAALLGDGGTNAAPVSLTNVAGRTGLCLDQVTIGSGAGLTFSTTQKFFGSASIHFTTVAAANVNCRWQQMYRPANPDLYASVWIYFAAIPAASTSILFVTDASIARICELRVISTGKVQAYDAAGVGQAVTATSIATNAWVRVDLLYTPHASAGKLQLKLYNTPASPVPTETTAQATGLNLRASGPTYHYMGIVNSAANQDWYGHFYFSDQGPAPFATGWTHSAIIGNTTPTSTDVVVRSLAAASIRLKVSTTADLLTAPVFSGAVVPDANGLSKLSITGLTASTQYYFGFEVDGTVDTQNQGSFKTYPALGAARFSFTSASCARNWSDSPAFDQMRTMTGKYGRALFDVHSGDMHYFADNTFVQNDFLNAYDKVMSSPKQLAWFLNTPVHYTWSDHDSGGSNHDGTDPAMPFALSAYKLRVPSYPLTDPTGIYHSFVVGRVRFIITDGRTYMSPIAATDDASKTKLGATQKAWLKARLIDPEPFKIWIHEDAWSNGATFGGDDTWSAYSTERAELAAYIQTNKVPMAYICGDLHCLASDSGTYTAGNIPVYVCSPLDNSAFIGNGKYTRGPVPNADSVPPNYYTQFGWFDVTDDGTRIALSFTGYDSTGAVLVRQSQAIVSSVEGGEMQGELNRIVGTSGIGEAGAANRWAGTTGYETVGALNIKNGSFGLEMQQVCNELAGTNGLGAVGALARIPAQ